MSKTAFMIYISIISLIGVPFYFLGVLFFGIIAYFLLLLYFIIYIIYIVLIGIAVKNRVPIPYLLIVPFILSFIVYGIILPFPASEIFQDISFLLAYLSFLVTYTSALILTYSYYRESPRGNSA